MEPYKLGDKNGYFHRNVGYVVAVALFWVPQRCRVEFSYPRVSVLTWEKFNALSTSLEGFRGVCGFGCPPLREPSNLSGEYV